SSRRRHTRFSRDWSSDVCSSDLAQRPGRRVPTREVLERNVAALEGGRHGFAFASGLAALDAALKLLSAGDHVVSGENVYGGSHRQMTLVWARLGFEFTFVEDRKSTRLNSSHVKISYAVFCLKKKKHVLIKLY